MLYELDIIDVLCEDLKQKGCNIVKRKKALRHEGADIIAKKNENGLNIFFYIEVVGGTSSEPTSKKFGEPFDSSQCKVHVSELLYACFEHVSMPKQENASYRIAMAFEDNKHYRKHVEQIKSALEEMKIEILFINTEKEITYN
ncbi:hypothetical protein [Bacillus sp. CECT 9360]|uniref:hypothetical protein n=1 Tax=Bacillus sp. CECT 9360 TaxID=2845821 RepID=UPI001E2A3C9E|nr:hypothetical protein [Bacillus sp. CECT 9360]